MKQQKFYMCTDQAALANLEKELAVRLNLDDLLNPSFSIKKNLLKLLLLSEN
jgi:hypothetical protein